MDAVLLDAVESLAGLPSNSRQIIRDCGGGGISQCTCVPVCRGGGGGRGMLPMPVYKQGDLTVSELLSSVFPASLFLFIPQKVLQSPPPRTPLSSM